MYQTLLEDSSDFDGFDVSVGYVLLCNDHAHVVKGIHFCRYSACTSLVSLYVLVPGTVPEYCIFYGCKFDSPKIMLFYSVRYNWQFQVCHIRG